MEKGFYMRSVRRLESRISYLEGRVRFAQRPDLPVALRSVVPGLQRGIEKCIEEIQELREIYYGDPIPTTPSEPTDHPG